MNTRTKTMPNMLTSSRIKTTQNAAASKTMLNVHYRSVVILLLLTSQTTLFGETTSGQAAGPALVDNLQQLSSSSKLEQATATATSGCDTCGGSSSQYYYTRTRNHPNHLRVAEEVKNQYVDEVKFESKINGTKYEYYKSFNMMSYDELVYETIDKIFRHRLSPFYIHHYDQDDDKRRSADPSKVSHESCARDLLYLVEKLPKRSLFRNPFASLDDDQSGGQNHQSLEDEPLTPELTAFFDSYARQEAGLLRGNTYWVGSHDQCVNRHIFELIDTVPSTAEQSSNNQRQQAKQQVVSFKGQYCVASLKAPLWDKMIANKKVKARNYFKSERQFQEYSKLFRLQLGICLPDSCDSTAYERHMDEIKLLAKSTLEPRFANYELIDLYCLPDEASPLRQLSSSALGFIFVITFWLALVLVASLADVLEVFDSQEADKCQKQKLYGDNTNQGSSRLSLFVGLLSIRANYRKLMHVNPAEGEDVPKNRSKPKLEEQSQDKQLNENKVELNEQSPKQEATQDGQQNTTSTIRGQTIQVDLRFLNAFKALIMFWIINGHIMLLMIQTAKNILDSDALLNGLMHFLIGATFGVDLFFTMTGFLTSYLLFNSGHAYKMKIGTWIYLSFHRYWRLAPMYLLTFWFSRSVMQSLGAGPLWDYGTSSMTFRGLCNNESWWYPLTLTSNLHGLFEECMITSWYISCDMQFWLVSPVFIYLLAKSPVNGWLVTIMTIVASSKMRYDAVMSDKSARYDELVQPRADIFMRVSHDLPAIYTHPHYRIAAYLVGMLAGHYVYMIKSGKWSSVLTEDLAQRQAAAAAVACGGEQSNKVETTRNNQDASSLVKQSSASDDKLITTTIETSNLVTKSKTTTLTPSLTRAQRSRRTRNTLAYFGLILSIIMASCSYLLANYFPSAFLKHSKPIAGFLYSLDHLAMSLGASLVIVTMCLGQWTHAVRFLSHPNWTRLSKINYALLLFQCEAIYFQIFRYDQVPMAGTRELINILFNLLVTLYPLAFLATLVLEFPLANMEKIAMNALLFGGKTKGAKTKTKTTANGSELQQSDVTTKAAAN